MGRGGSSSSSSNSLVLDSERGELVRAPTKLGQKVISEGKSLAALKSHSEAERRRRERINSHLDTLRSLVPCTDKMDKASLLAEVISHVKELKRTAVEASKGFVIPMDIDEVRVEPHEDGVLGGPFCIRASLCCDDRPEILPNLREALEACKLETVKVEISTLAGRMKNVFVMTGCKEENSDDTEVRRLLMSSVHKALRSVLDKIPTSSEFSPRIMLPNKRRRISLFDSSSSSS
ncbi:Myc-type [Macleaya cordata]|uniref:Myc-type n=1 Tax=Macleaya cordata TaxID=56857 RepID=A0A200QFH0_MACCD|nr:Myc-type [Macleaya cordata]